MPSAALDQEVLVKATPLNAILVFMDENLPEAARERVLAAAEKEFPEPVRKVREKSILAFDRFPLRFANQLLQDTANELRKPGPEIAHAIGRRGAEEAAKGVLRLALTMISIPALLRKLEPVWSQLYTHGKMVTESHERRAVIELQEFPLVSELHCARVTGWFEWFAQKAEKSARIRHTTCRARGEGVCRWDLIW